MALTTWGKGRAAVSKPEVQGARVPAFSNCISCGNCLEVCPQVNEHSQFGWSGRSSSQVRLFNMHPTGAMNKERAASRRFMGPGGIQGLFPTRAELRPRVPPKNIPLTESIAAVNRDGLETGASRLARVNSLRDLQNWGEN